MSPDRNSSEYLSTSDNYQGETDSHLSIDDKSDEDLTNYEQPVQPTESMNLELKQAYNGWSLYRKCR